jgi:hypothetical protein
MIKHTVTFSFKDDTSTADKNEFFKAGDHLKNIPGVQKLRALRRIDNGNNGEYAFFMEFENEDIYKAYTDHALHQSFIKNYWLKFVADFKEMDFENI